MSDNSGVSPTGRVHEVGIDDVFFSVTDRRGVIEHANELFTRFSRYDRDALIGSPHSVIRHPDMPSGVFHAMWAELHAGRPFAGHVKNLAADGSTYFVYATVTPLGDDGYLSVRIRPMDNGSSTSANNLYEALKMHEVQLRQSGLNRREVAARSADKLREMLNDAGLASLAALRRQVLPKEIAKFERRSAGFPCRPDAKGHLADVLATVAQVDSTLGSWSMQQHQLATLSASLRRVSDELQHELDASASTCERIREHAELSPESRGLLAPLTVWTQMQGLIQSYVVEVIAALQHLDENSAENRFLVALAKLHTRMMASFVAELIDAEQHAERQAAAVLLLAQALRTGLAEMREHSIAHRDLIATTVASVSKSASVLAIPRELLLDWQRESESVRLSPAMQRLASDVTASVTKVGEILEELETIVDLCGQVRIGDEPDALLLQVAGVEEAIKPFESNA